MEIQVQDGFGDYICNELHRFTIDGNLARIVTFDASKNESAIDLKWTVNQVEEGSPAEVQKSNDGTSFESIFSDKYEVGIDAAQYFEKKDFEPAIVDNFYRMMITNSVGERSFSEVRRVNISDVEDFGLFPNPAKENVNISLRGYEELTGKVQLINQFGQVMLEEQLSGSGRPNYELSLRNFPNGIYTVWIFADGKRPVGKKLIVRKMY